MRIKGGPKIWRVVASEESPTNIDDANDSKLSSLE